MNISLKKLFNGSERSKNLKKNILGTVALKGVSIIVQLLLVPLTLTYLSDELYGIWLTISSIVLWLNFFDVGFSLGLKNKLTEAIAKNDYTRGKELVSTTYGMLILIFVPLGIILEFIIPLINWSSFLNVSAIYNSTLINVVKILVVSFVLQMVFNTIGTIAASFQKVALGSSFPVIGNLLSLIAIWFLTKFTEPSLINMAWAVSFIPVVVFTISSLILFNGFLKPIRPNIHQFKKNIIKDIFSLGFRFFIIQIQMIVMQQSTNILITNISSPDFVTYYNIAYRYVGTAIMIFSLILGPLWPAFTDAYTKNDFQWMNQIYKKLIKLYLLVLISIWIMVALSPIVYKLWIGETTLIPISMTIMLAIYFSISSWDNIQVGLINGIGAIKLQSYITIIGLVFHIPFSLLFGRYIGAYGVVLSMILIVSIYSSVFTIQLRRILKIKAKGIWIA